MPSTLRSGLLATTALLTVGALAACSDNEVSVDDLEEQVSTMFTQEVGWTPAEVDCPDELDAEVDATTRCVASDEDGGQLGVTVTVTGVDGDRVEMDVQADDELLTPPDVSSTTPTDDSSATPNVSAADVEQQTATMLTDETGVAPASVECPGDLNAEIGTTMRCTINATDGTRIGVTLTVTSVDGDVVNWDFQVDDAPG